MKEGGVINKAHFPKYPKSEYFHLYSEEWARRKARELRKCPHCGSYFGLTLEARGITATGELIKISTRTCCMRQTRL